MTSRTLMATALAAAIAAAAPAFAQPAPTPAPTQQGQQRPGAAPSTHPSPAASGQPTPMPQVTFEEIVGDITSGQTISPTAIGVGAIAGVVVFNIVAPALFPLTYATGGPLVGTILADSAVAATRIYTVSSAVAGAWVGQWVYTNWLSR